jgi:hypothetical protein
MLANMLRNASSRLAIKQAADYGNLCVNLNSDLGNTKTVCGMFWRIARSQEKVDKLKFALRTHKNVTSVFWDMREAFTIPILTKVLISPRQEHDIFFCIVKTDRTMKRR